MKTAAHVKALALQIAEDADVVVGAGNGVVLLVVRGDAPQALVDNMRDAVVRLFPHGKLRTLKLPKTKKA